MIGKIARSPLWTRTWVLPALGAGLIVGSLATVWLGYIATEEWRRSTVLLVQRTLEEELALAHTSVVRDMRGAQALILTVTREEIFEPVPHDLLQTCARIFAKYPYPESVFSWRRRAGSVSDTYVFSRSTRLPAWRKTSTAQTPFPVERTAGAGELGRVIDTVLDYADSRLRLVAFETSIDGAAYQVIARLDYEQPGSNVVASTLGFTVNLDWVRERYFPELVEQVSRLGGSSAVMSLAVVDDAGAPLGSVQGRHFGGTEREREFPLLFMDPGQLPLRPPPELPLRRWCVRVWGADGESLRSVSAAASRTFLLICVAVAAMAGGLGLTLRAVVAGARLAALKSDLLAALTHELKTPISSIHLASETLARHRYSQEEAVKRYAGLLLRESSRLNRLVTNLLTFARLTDVRSAYAPEAVHVGDLIEDALESLQTQIEERRATINLEIAADLPPVRADRAGMFLVFENLLDNAIRYSTDAPVVSIVCRATQLEVHVWVTDQGPGIAGQDIAAVFEKFVRGPQASSGGTGLGLAIARRIIEDNRGRIELRSALGEGTQVFIRMPACTEGQGHVQARAGG